MNWLKKDDGAGMKMKLLGLGIMAQLLGSGGMAYAGTNVISFEGEITPASCNVFVEGQEASAGSGTVNLPHVGKSALSAAGSSAGRVSFALVAKDCTFGSTVPALTKVGVFFEGGPDGVGPEANNVDPSSGYLNNTQPAGPTTATNVQLRLIDGTSNKVIKVGNQTQVTEATYYVPTGSPATARMFYAVEYYSANGGATEGTVHSTVVYDLMYE